MKEVDVRTLSLLRHAKSSWDDEFVSDFERPLAPRGRKAAPLVGRHMREIGLRPDLILCSSAVRTRQTAGLVLAELGMPGLPVVYDDTIYEATTNRLLARLQRVEPSVGHVLMIGHNPGFQRLALLLASDGLDGESLEIAEKFPTAALVVLELDIDDWAEIGEGCGTVTHLATPRKLQSD